MPTKAGLISLELLTHAVTLYCSIFDKAMKFYGKKYELDFDTLQYEFDENFDDYRDWLDQLDSYDTDLIDEKGFTVDNVPEDLSAVLMADKDEAAPCCICTFSSWLIAETCGSLC